MTQTQKLTAKLNAAIARANDGGKVRTLDIRDVAQVLAEAIRDEYGYTTGGSVAKSYTNHGTAWSTKAFAVANGPDYIALTMTRGNALGSPVTFAGPSQATDKSIRTWAARQTLYTLRDWLILTRAECKLIIRSLVALKLSDVPDVPVTTQDSLAAGNCRMTTDRVAGWFAPRVEVSARELAKAIMAREPLLVPFAKRAIAQAARRAEVSAHV